MKNFLKTLCAAAMMVSLCALPNSLYAQVRRTTTTNSENSSKEKSTQVRRTGTRNREQVRRTGSDNNRRTVSSSQSSQVRRTGSSSTDREQIRRTGSDSNRRTVSSSQSSQDRRPSGHAVRPSSDSRDGRVVRSNTNVTGGNGLGHYDSNRKPTGGYCRGDDFFIRDSRLGDDYYDYRIREHNLYRIPPYQRNFMKHERISNFYGPDEHYFGWRVSSLPPRCARVSYYGVEYYTCGNVYYRRFHEHYVVSRPPVGITIEARVGRKNFLSVRFSYFPSQYRSYRGFDDYSRYIDRQNRIIAENNALIAAQNRMIALNTSSARSSYKVANALGLVQSYAYADREYFYQDGVFYIINERGRYQVIVPPAGALVERLPEDYDVIVLNGREYYRVDDTVYRTVLVYGVPQLEVLGQMYGNMARKHNRFYRDYDDDWDDDWDVGDWD